VYANMYAPLPGQCCLSVVRRYALENAEGQRDEGALHCAWCVRCAGHAVL